MRSFLFTNSALQLTEFLPRHRLVYVIITRLVTVVHDFAKSTSSSRVSVDARRECTSRWWQSSRWRTLQAALKAFKVHYHYFIFIENNRKTNLETDDGTCPKRQLFNKTNNTGIITESADEGATCEASAAIKSHGLGTQPLFIIRKHLYKAIILYYLVISRAVPPLFRRCDRPQTSGWLLVGWEGCGFPW